VAAARAGAGERDRVTRLPRGRLAGLIAKLRSFHLEPEAPPVRGPYHLLLWEQVGYLADQPRRFAAYLELEERVGLTPRQILEASDASLRAVARKGGGIAVAQRASRLRAVADRVLLCGSHPILGLDTNALRVLQRLGYACADAPWARRTETRKPRRRRNCRGRSPR